MSANAAAPVAAPPADVSTASILDNDDMFDLTDDKGAVIPETNFDVPVDGKPGGVTRAKPAETVDIDNGEVKAAKPGEVDESGANAEDDEIGEPYTIGKDGRVRGKDGKYIEKPADAAEAKAEETPKKEASPFRYRTQGETHDFEGASVDPDTGDITIKAARAGVLREALNALNVRNVEHIPTIQKMTERTEALEAELKTAREHGSVKEAQAEATLQRLDAALGEPDEGKAVEMFFKLRESLPQLKLEAEKEYYRRLAEGKSKAPSAAALATAAAKTEDAGRSDSASASLAADAIAEVADITATLAIQHEYRDVTAEDWQQFNARMKRTPMAYFRPATAKDAKQFGVQVGETVFDHDLVNEDIKSYVDGLREQRAVAKRREELAADRSRRTAPQVTTPPAVERGAPAPKAKERGITSKNDWDNWLDSPGLD